MSFNYGNTGNQALQNILPLFGNGTNNAPNLMSQLVAAMQSSVGCISGANNNASQVSRANPAVNASGSTSAPTPSIYSRKRRSLTPEPPPAPRLSIYAENKNNPKMKPNQGALPMDLENDVETEANTNSNSKANNQQQMLKGPTANEATLMLNALMSGSVNTAGGGYMFFPTAASSMLMDPSSMMAAAMQQMHGYSSYMPTAADGSGAAMAQDCAVDSGASTYPGQTVKEIIKTKHCTLFPPNPHAPPPTIRERPPGCRTVFVGGLPELATEEIVREIFESCGEITTLRMSKKNFCHIRYRQEASIDRAIYMSGYRVRISSANEPANFGRLHVDYAQARDDQYDYECKQRQLQREQRHRDRTTVDHRRSQSPPPIPHYSDIEASLVSECLRSNESFVKAVQTISVWLERGDCSKRNANVFYSMIQSTHAHVRRLHSDKQQLEEELKKARESYRKQMLVMSKQFTQIEKVFNAASHKKVWDHFSKAQRKNIDQWKKLATELRSVQIEDDEMEMSDEDRDNHGSGGKRVRYDSEHLKDENDSLRCQLEAMRNEMSLERTDIKYDSDFREKQIKVLQETIRNMQTQLLQMKSKEQKESKTIEQLERKLKECGVKQLLLKTKIRETTEKLKERENSSRNSEISDVLMDDADLVELVELVEQDTDTENKKDDVAEERSIDLEKTPVEKTDNVESIDLDVIPDEIVVVENQCEVVEIADNDEVVIIDEPKQQEKNEVETSTKINPEELQTPETEVKMQQKNHVLLLSEARIIALVTAFLLVHPLGVSSDYILNYLRDFLKPCSLDAVALADILNKYTNLFKASPKQELPDSDVIIKWNFCGYVPEPIDELSNNEPQEIEIEVEQTVQ